MTEGASSHTRPPRKQMTQYPVDLDGKEYIAVHPNAKTELGRLLHGDANTPFVVYGMDNPNLDGGAWESFYQAARCVSPRWVDEAVPHVPNKTNSAKLAMWFRWKLEQNWYILDLFKRTKYLPIVFMAAQTKVEENGVVVYQPLTQHQWLTFYLHKLRREWRERDKRIAEAREKARRS